MAQWKDVPRYEGLYLVSDEGQIISLSKKIKTRNKYENIEVTINNCLKSWSESAGGYCLEYI